MTSAAVAPIKEPVHDSLVEQLAAIRSGMLALEQKYSATLESLPQTHQTSARNLVHYLALRRHDLRGLQHSLASLGLSSLGRMEFAKNSKARLAIRSDHSDTLLKRVLLLTS